MAYVDQNGLVMIDEAEAAEDIAKLKKTVELMNEALVKLNEIENINSASKGDSTVAVDNVAIDLIKQVNNQKSEIEHSIKTINDLITRYKDIDARSKNQINSSMN